MADNQKKMPPVRETGAGYSVRSVKRAVSILRTFSFDRPTLGLAEIADRSGLDKATARRLLVTLRDVGMIDQDRKSQRYCLGRAVREIAATMPRFDHLSDAADPVLATLARTTQTTVFLIVRRGTEAICIGRYVSNSAIRVQWWDVGVARPINCGAAARLLLAFSPDDVFAQVLDGDLEKFTARSFTEPSALRAERPLAREQGWVLAVDDVCEGLAALAAPIRDSAGEVIAAISLSGLTAQLVENGHPRLLMPLRSASRQIEDRLQGA